MAVGLLEFWQADSTWRDHVGWPARDHRISGLAKSARSARGSSSGHGWGGSDAEFQAASPPKFASAADVAARIASGLPQIVETPHGYRNFLSNLPSEG